MGACVEGLSTTLVASRCYNGLTFTFENKVDMFSIVIGLMAMLFYSFSAV